MRGRRISQVARKLDVVLVSARYDENDGRLQVARGYERRGFVWSDLVLFDRQSLIDRLKARKRVVTGQPVDLPGDFEAIAKVQLVGEQEAQYIVANGHLAGKDDLGVPLF